MYILCTVLWRGTYLHGAIGTTESLASGTIMGMKAACEGTVRIMVEYGVTVHVAGKTGSTVKVRMGYFI